MCRQLRTRQAYLRGKRVVNGIRLLRSKTSPHHPLRPADVSTICDGSDETSLTDIDASSWLSACATRPVYDLLNAALAIGDDS